METQAWGVILADMAGHVADVLCAEGTGPRAALYDATIGSFYVEATTPTAQRAETSPSGWAEGLLGQQQARDERGARGCRPDEEPD